MGIDEKAAGEDARKRQVCAVHIGKYGEERLTRAGLASELAKALRQWSPYERVPRKYPFRGRPTGRVTECRYCGARGETPCDVEHDEDCAYRSRRETLKQARKEGLI